MEGRDAVSYDYPLLSGTYNRRHYLTAYGKEQKTEFENIIIDRSGGSPDSYSGIVSVSEGMVTMGDNGSATYRFSVSSAGTYDVAVRLCFPFWDKNGIYISIDGSRKHFTESRLWWPYWRTTFWSVLAKGISLSAGTHTITVSVDVKGVQFYGFRVCHTCYGKYVYWRCSGKSRVRTECHGQDFVDSNIRKVSAYMMGMEEFDGKEFEFCIILKDI